MKLDQFIEYNKEKISKELCKNLEKFCKKWGRDTSPTPLFIYLKSLIGGKR